MLNAPIHFDDETIEVIKLQTNRNVIELLISSAFFNMIVWVGRYTSGIWLVRVK